MPAIINGNPANVTTPIVRTIASMANNGAGAYRVLTSAPHFFGDRDDVTITGTGTTADGVWVISVVDSTHFDLVGSMFASSGTGTATDYSLSPQMQVPTSGDAAVAPVSTWAAIADKLAYLQRKTAHSAYQLVQLYQADRTEPAYGNSTYATWTSTTFVTTTNLALGGITGTMVGDIVEVNFVSTIELFVTTAQTVTAIMRLEEQQGAVAIAAPLGASAAISLNTPGATSLDAPIALNYLSTITTPGAYNVFLDGTIGVSSGSPSCHGKGEWYLTVKLWRATL